MPSQQLPKSAKFDSLPSDLKAIADKLIKAKFKIPEDKPKPEVVKKKSPQTYDVVDMQQYSYELIPTRQLPQYGSSRLMSGERPPRTLTFAVSASEDPRRISQKFEYELDRLRREWGLDFDIRPLNRDLRYNFGGF